MLAENTILIIGDSISAGYGITINQGWAALLQQRLSESKFPYRVINASITGDTTSGGLSRMPSLLKQYSPQITIIELGGNDGLRGLQISIINNNLLNMIQLAKLANSKVVILGVRMPPNYGVVYTQPFAQIYSDLEKRRDISVIPNVLINIDSDHQLMQADGVHPNEKAQINILNNVWPDLKKLLH